MTRRGLSTRLPVVEEFRHTVRPRPASSGLTVTPVNNERDLTIFIRLPWRLYRGSPLWVPPLLAERRRHLDRGRNPFFEHAEAEYFLAWRDGVAVGRVSAQVDRHLQEFQHNRWGQFGFFESENDPEVAAALLDAAADWLAEHGAEEMLGPFDFGSNHESGLLVSGHERSPQILENWHHPYYRQLIEGQGMTKAMDLYKWEIQTADRSQMPPIIDELAGRLEADHGIHLRRMRRRDLQEELIAFRDIHNSAWSATWGFVPLTDHELKHMEHELRPILDEEFTCVAETAEGEVVGLSLSLPDMNQVLSRLNGHLLPLGWVTAARERSRIDELRVFALGVKPEYQHTGTAAALYRDVWDTARRRGIKRAETGWILETNEPMNRAMEALTGRIVKRHRVYERPLSAARLGGLAAPAGR